MARRYAALELDLPGEVAEAALALLGTECLGAELRPAGSRGERLVAYFPSAAAARAAASQIETLLWRHGWSSPAGGPLIRPVEDEAWVERYQASLRPFEIGAGFVVDPTGRAAARAGRRHIALVPGRAFGTGEHATTRLCVAALERRVEPGSRWVDLGCGSGILAVVAAACGADHVRAVDRDEEAVEVAREVVRRNHTGERIAVVPGSETEVEPGAWDGVVANIDGAFFRQRAAAVGALPRRGGTLIASGFLEQQRSEVQAALLAAGLTEVERATLDDWGLVVLARPSAGGA